MRCAKKEVQLAIATHLWISFGLTAVAAKVQALFPMLLLKTHCRSFFQHVLDMRCMSSQSELQACVAV